MKKKMNRAEKILYEIIGDSYHIFHICRPIWANELTDEVHEYLDFGYWIMTIHDFDIYTENVKDEGHIEHPNEIYNWDFYESHVVGISEKDAKYISKKFDIEIIKYEW